VLHITKFTFLTNTFENGKRTLQDARDLFPFIKIILFFKYLGKG